MSEEKIGSLEEEALKRKERLQALKRKNEESEGNKTNTDEILPKPKFRSYKPQDENLKNNMLEDAKPGDVESEVREQLDAASSKVVIEELHSVNKN